MGGPVLEFRLSGDWVFWLRMIRASGVAYVAEPLNFYRCHAQTVRSASLQGGLWLEEMARVIADLYPELSLPPGDVRRLQEHFWMLWSQHATRGKSLGEGIGGSIARRKVFAGDWTTTDAGRPAEIAAAAGQDSRHIWAES